jgi:hypothetical protein
MMALTLFFGLVGIIVVIGVVTPFFLIAVLPLGKNFT